jgi:hypothetical protein
MRRHINRIKKDVLEIGVTVGAQNANRVFNVTGVNRIAALQQVVEFTQEFAGKRLFGMPARDAEHATVHPDLNAQSLLNSADMAVVLAKQLSKETMVVEMKFERILIG